MKAPFVCNGCAGALAVNAYIQDRRIYVARNAQIEYQTLLVEAREGIPLNKEEFYHNKQIISNAVRAGQHVFHAIHANDLSVSKIPKSQAKIKRLRVSESPIPAALCMLILNPRIKEVADRILNFDVRIMINQNLPYDLFSKLL